MSDVSTDGAIRRLCSAWTCTMTTWLMWRHALAVCDLRNGVWYRFKSTSWSSWAITWHWQMEKRHM